MIRVVVPGNAVELPALNREGVTVRVPLPEGRVDQWICAQPPWMLEPDAAHLVALMREAVADPDERARRGAVAAAAARALSWDAVADGYRERIVALAAKPPTHRTFRRFRAHIATPHSVIGHSRYPSSPEARDGSQS